MNHDIINILKNIQTLSENNDAFRVLKDFERVLDELDIYVFKNWEDGELVEGPIVGRYSVKCTFMWDLYSAPDTQGATRLNDYGCKVVYARDKILIPRKIRDPEDYRPGTKKGKIDAHPIWTVSIEMPKKLMQDVYIGKENKENNLMAELMHYSESEITPDAVAQEAPIDTQQDISAQV